MKTNLVYNRMSVVDSRTHSICVRVCFHRRTSLIKILEPEEEAGLALRALNGIKTSLSTLVHTPKYPRQKI